MPGRRRAGCSVEREANYLAVGAFVLLAGPDATAWFDAAPKAAGRFAGLQLDAHRIVDERSTRDDEEPGRGRGSNRRGDDRGSGETGRGVMIREHLRHHQRGHCGREVGCEGDDLAYIGITIRPAVEPVSGCRARVSCRRSSDRARIGCRRI